MRPAFGAWLRAADRRWSRRPLLVAALAWGLSLLLIDLSFPGTPLQSDTQEYSSFAAHRPPLYGLLLMLWRHIVAVDLAGLAVFQLALVALAQAALAAALAKRVGSVLGVVPVLVASALASGSGRYELQVAQTEALYLCMICGILVLLMARPIARAWPLLCLILALALLLRSSAIALLPGLLLVGLVAWRQRRLRLVALVAGPLLAIGAAATASIGINAALNQRPVLAQWGGMSAMGRALLALPDPVPPAFPPAAQAILPQLRAAQAHMDAAPSLLLRLQLAQGQADTLRFVFFWPAVSGVAWADRPVEQLYEWGLLGGRLASETAARAPAAMLMMAGYGYLGFWLQPRLLSPWIGAQERAWLEANPVPGQAQVTWPIVDLARGNDLRARLRALPLPAMLLLGGVVGVGVMLAGLNALLRSGAVAPPDDLLFAAAALHASALLVAATEFGLLRYALPLVPAAMTLALQAAAHAWRTAARRRLPAGAPTGS